MQKSKLDKFISKYNLGGNVNSVKWKSNGNLLTLTLPNKDLSGVTNDVDIESPLDFHFTEFTFPPKLYF